MANLMHLRRAPSAKALQTIKDVDKATAEAIRAVWKTVANRQEARKKIDTLLQTHGVEFLGIHKRTGESIYYCNAGDTYTGTVLFSGLRCFVGCWGDLVEKNLIRAIQ